MLYYSRASLYTLYIYIYIYTHKHTYIHTYIYIYMIYTIAQVGRRARLRPAAKKGPCR